MANKEKQIERRFIQASEIRSDETGNKLVGYAAVFNSPTQIDNYWEVIRPGAFTKTIKDGSDVRALINHDPNLVLGRTKSGTLILSEDEHGLKVEITLPNTSIANDLRESIKRGDISQMSFGFYIMQKRWTTLPEDSTQALLEILECQLFDVSPVTYPAYEDTEVSVRNISNIINSIKDIDEAEKLFKQFFEKLDERNIYSKEIIKRFLEPIETVETEESVKPLQEKHLEFNEVDNLRKRLELKMKNT